MTDRVEPALSAEEWSDREVEVRPRWYATLGPKIEWQESDEPEYPGLTILHADAAYPAQDCEVLRLPALIALANAALPDEDPRKITREDVDNLREWISELTEHNSVADANSGHLRKIADALDSYLPPVAS